MISIRAASKISMAWLRQPVMGRMLESRPLCAGIAAAGVLQVALSMAGLPGFTCAFHQVTGLPCPGCGLTRGVCELMGGHWSLAIEQHAFAPVAAVAIFLLIAGSVVPNPVHRRLVRIVSEVERKTCVSQIALLLLWAYWISQVCGL